MTCSIFVSVVCCAKLISILHFRGRKTVMCSFIKVFFKVFYFYNVYFKGVLNEND